MQNPRYFNKYKTGYTGSSESRSTGSQDAESQDSANGGLWWRQKLSQGFIPEKSLM